MFSRINFDSFQLLFPVIGFFLFAAIFILAVIQVCLMKRNSVSHLSSLPLEDDETHRPTRSHDQS